MIQKQTQSKENVVDLHLILEASESAWSRGPRGCTSWTRSGGYEEVLQAFKRSSTAQITPRTKVFAKILIDDIYMSCLVDFSAILKIAEIAQSSSKDKAVIVLYMGTAHTKAVTDSFVRHMGFRENGLMGKIETNEQITVTQVTWNFSELLPSKIVSVLIATIYKSIL
jgi:hypothetical protein